MFSHRTDFNQRHATTLIEIIISVLLGSLLLLAATKLLSGGMKSRAKGSSHLAIVQATSILMAQLEEDMRRAASIVVPAAEAMDNQLQLHVWEIDDSTGMLATSTIYYTQNLDSSQGIMRTHEYHGNKQTHIYCANFTTTGSFTQIITASTNRIGLFATFHTISTSGGKEEFLLSRFLFSQSHPGNNFARGWDAQ